MKQINSPSMGQRTFNGEYGNKSAAHLYAILAAQPANSTINLGEFSGGVRADDLKVVTENLGAGTTLKIGVSYPRSATPDVVDQFMTITTTSKKCTRFEEAPIRFEEGFVLTATLEGGSGTGKVDVVIDYTYEGMN